jgi:hypothetical protein
MLTKILTAAAIPAREARFPDPPEETHAVYFDSVTADGPDGINRIFTHDCTVELYARTPDNEAKARLEAQLDAHGIAYTTQGWYWLDSLRRYQEIYEFQYITKL